MQKALKLPQKGWFAIGVFLVAVLTCLAAAGMAEAGSSGTSVSFDVTRGLPGSAAQRYTGSYHGSSMWNTTGSYSQVNYHRSDMIWNNINNVKDPFTSIDCYRDGSLFVSLNKSMFTLDPAFISSEWYRQGGISNAHIGAIGSDTMDAKGRYGFRLCGGGHCASGLSRTASWELW